MDLILIAASHEERIYACRFAPDDACFHEHFPDSPVLPGSFVTALSLQAVREDFGQTGTPTIERFTFRRFATPGAYELRIEARANAFSCRLLRDQIVYAEGRIACA